MVLVAIAYGIFFGFLSQIFIYRNDISFSQQGIVIPSINIIPWSDTSVMYRCSLPILQIIF